MEEHVHLRLRERRGRSPARQIRDAWLELDLGDWIAAWRLFLKQGQLVAGELRLNPKELPYKEPGSWSAERIGSDALVPEGGITARLLRQVKLSEALAARPDLRRKAVEFLGGKPTSRAETDGETLQEDVPRRPGRGGRDVVFLARVAARYVGLCEDGSIKPIEDLRTWLDGQGQKFPEPTVRGFLHQARQRGLLTRPQKGTAGGQLTEVAEAILFEAREAQMKHWPPKKRRGSA
jgi:hypothetical protein